MHNEEYRTLQANTDMNDTDTDTDTVTDTVTDLNQIHEGVQALVETHWNHNWSDLPPEQEKKIEEAFCLVSEVRDELSNDVGGA